LNQAPARLEVEDLQENLRAVQEHLQHDRPKAELRAQLDRLHAADIAAILEALPLEERLAV
jgi:Mg/Co/Ni transporter MgtE